MSDVSLDTMHDDLEAYALGALDGDNARAFERHAEACDDCRRGLVSYIPVTNALRSIPAVVPPVVPSVNAITAPLRTATVARQPVLAAVPSRRRFLPVAFAYAAAAAVLLILGGAISSQLGPRTDRQLMTIAGMLADGPRQAVLLGDGVRGRVIVGRRNLRAAVVLRGLPQPPHGSTYHVWLVDSKPVMVGALTPAREGLEVLMVDARRLRAGHAVEVSLEAPDASAPGSTFATGRL